MPGITPPTPYNWSVGDVASGSLLNAQLYNLSTFLQNPPSFYGYSTTALTFNSASWTVIPLDSEVWDTEGGHSTTTNTSRYTCQIAGRYQFWGGISFKADSTAGFRAAKFLVNTSTTIVGSEVAAAPVTGFPTTPRLLTEIQLNVGDYVELWGYQNSGVAVGQDTNSGHEYATCMGCRWVSN